MFGYINTFAVVMNPDSYNNLPPDLQQLIDQTTGKAAAKLAGQRWDAVEGPGKQYMIDSGVNIIELGDAERAAFAAVAQQVIEQRLADTEAKGLPAREFYARLKELAQQY